MKKLIFSLIVAILGTSVDCYSQAPTNLSVDIIPKPLEVIKNAGYFGLSENTLLVADKYFDADVDFIISQIQESTNLTIATKKSEPTTNKIVILRSHEQMDDEAYSIDVDADNITIQASERGGIINALASLRQLILVNNNRFGSRVIYVPAVEINDSPVFAWRGFMIDISRHFFSMDQVREMVDQMAYLKLNVLHLHLSDDQGYRMESKKFPKLNTIGSWRVDHNCTDEQKNAFWGKPAQQEGEPANYGGFFTQKELKELVEYAKQRNIDVLPEIDVPGHAQAIIASYPEATCFSERDYYVATGGVRGNNTICPTQEFSYELMAGIIEELVDVFPFEYIHIGGDECSKGLWSKHKKCQDFIKERGMKDENELQSYFIHKLEQMVNSHGKKMIGWDEILDGGLAPNATVMSWRGEDGGIASAKMGHDVIMTPSTYNYLDLKQGQSCFEPNLGYSRVLLSETYNSTVIPSVLTEEQAKYIIGNQANQWSESLSDYSKLNYMNYPRLFAVAENCWTPESIQSWDDFVVRLQSHLTIFDRDGVRYAKSVFNPWIHHRGVDNGIKVWFTSELSVPEIRYTTNGEDPTVESMLYSDTIVINESTVVKAAIFEDGVRLGDVQTKNYPVHKASNAKTVITIAGDTICGNRLTDLSYGEFLESVDPYWVSLSNNSTIEIQFDSPTNISSVVINTQRMTLSKVYTPERIEVYADVDGESVKVADSGLIEDSRIQGRNIISYRLDCKVGNVSNLRVKIYNLKSIPSGHVDFNVGQSASYSIDEIQVF